MILPSYRVQTSGSQVVQICSSYFLSSPKYIEILREQDVAEHSIKKLIRAILALGQAVEIRFYHLPHYPPDPDDIAFVLCADNGNATHIVSYDRHLKAIEPYYPFTVCKPVQFLRELRKTLA